MSVSESHTSDVIRNFVIVEWLILQVGSLGVHYSVFEFTI